MEIVKEIQGTNIISCNLLVMKGFDGRLLGADLKKKKDTTVVLTVPHTQDWLKALAKAATYGALFVATGGEHFTYNVMFCDSELPVRKEQVWKWKG